MLYAAIEKLIQFYDKLVIAVKNHLSWFVYTIIFIIGVVALNIDNDYSNPYVNYFKAGIFTVFSGILLRGISKLSFSDTFNRDNFFKTLVSGVFTAVMFHDVKTPATDIINNISISHDKYDSGFFLKKTTNDDVNDIPYYTFFFPNGGLTELNKADDDLTTDNSHKLSKIGYQLTLDQRTIIENMAEAFNNCADRNRNMVIKINGSVSTTPFKDKNNKLRTESDKLNIELANNRAASIAAALNNKVDRSTVKVTAEIYDEFSSLTPRFSLADGKTPDDKSYHSLNRSATIYLVETGNCEVLSSAN